MSSQQQQPTSANTLTTSTHRSTLAHIQGTTYGQSFSGSETDVSTSTENLSPEERYALEHTQRQEPQGQENVGNTANSMANSQICRVNTPVTSVTTVAPATRSNESNASICSSTNTLIIHNNVSDDPWQHRWLPGGYSTPMAGRKSVPSNLHDNQEGAATYNSQVHKLNMESLNLNSSLLNSSVLNSSAINSSLISSSLLNSSVLDSSALTQKTAVPSYLSQNNILGSSKLSSHTTATDLPDIPSSYLDQSEVLKHLLGREGKGGHSDQSASSSNSGINLLTENAGPFGRDLSQMPLQYNLVDAAPSYDVVNLPPPPAYPIWRLQESEKLEQQMELAKHGPEKSNLSKSQPDLTKFGNAKEATSPKELLSQRIVSGQTDHADGHLQEMADILVQENKALKMEIDMYHRKVAKLQRFEIEIIKVHEAHEGLVKLSERREQLERLARHKLQAEVKRLTDLNADLKDQVDVLSTQIANRAIPSDNTDALRKELNKRDVFIAQLVSQNKELIAAKERQEIELTAQRQTLNEQRTHIDILDSALTNAQANVVKLEEELRKKQNLVEQAGQLKRLLVSLQLAADRREQSEKNLRQRLEKEIEQLRLGVRQEEPASKLSDLRRELREKEEKIMVLEGEVTKWEQRYLQESAMRQLAIDAVSLPKDAKIAALEKTSQESERRIAQAKSEKLRHMDEIHNMNKKQTEYEARNRELESHVAERDAMIRVLQKRAEEKEAMYQKALMRNSLVAGKSLEGRSNSNNNSVVHSTQASTVHSHTSSGLGGATGGSSTPGTPRRDEELGCAPPPIPPFPALSHPSGTSTPSKSSAPNPYLELASTSFPSTSLISTSSASSTSSVSGATAAAAQENQAAGGRGRLREHVGDRLRADSCGRARRSPVPVRNLDSHSHSSDDLLVDNEDAKQGKLRVVCFPGLAHPGVAAGEGPVSQSLLECVDPSPALVPLTHCPASDMPRLGLGMDSSSVMRPCSDMPVLSCPPYDPLPSYPLEGVGNIPLPPPRDFSSMVPQQPQPQQQAHLAQESRLQAIPIMPATQPRGNPPPYHGRHEVLTQQSRGPQMQTPVLAAEQGAAVAMPGSPTMTPNRQIGPNMSPSTPNLATEMPVPRPAMCRNPHHPTVACRKCNSVRSSNRQNAAILVRRANSSAGQTNRNSAPLPACQSAVDTDDAPSILARLRREWELENNQAAGSNSQIQSLSPPMLEQGQACQTGISAENGQQKHSSAQTSEEPKETRKIQQQNQKLPSPSKIQSPQEFGDNPQCQKGSTAKGTTKNYHQHHQLSPQAHTSREKAFDQQQQAYASVHNTRPPDQLPESLSPVSMSSASTPHSSPVSNQMPTKLHSPGPTSSSRSQNMPENSSLNKVVVSTCNVTLSEIKNSITYSVNNKTTNHNQINRNNDINHTNNNQEEKIELIILEDTDHLKVPPNNGNITEAIQDII
ncbi:angiomotin-like isoform X2 [Penaeus japonicus]|uniref:angiomotin-like isoform X2 n=1 Tax=Penaeus japonicus TaxID=27405 RepID=UPI001C70B091|nr:angiomotin-like isoform X2 [Penaeus japonicus]